MQESWGRLWCQLTERKVEKDTLVMPERLMSLQLKIFILQVRKPWMKNLLDEEIRVSGLNVVKEEGSVGARALTKDAMEEDPRKPAVESPVTVEGLTPAACKGGDSVNSETVITRDPKSTWEWHHKPSKNASIKEESDDKKVQGRNAIKPPVEEPWGKVAEMPPNIIKMCEPPGNCQARVMSIGRRIEMMSLQVISTDLRALGPLEPGVRETYPEKISFSLPPSGPQ